jgi:hypothetical protein
MPVIRPPKRSSNTCIFRLCIRCSGGRHLGELRSLLATPPPPPHRHSWRCTCTCTYSGIDVGCSCSSCRDIVRGVSGFFFSASFAIDKHHKLLKFFRHLMARMVKWKPMSCEYTIVAPERLSLRSNCPKNHNFGHFGDFGNGKDDNSIFHSLKSML